MGLKENVIIGKLIPAGTGMKRYKNIKLDYGVNEEFMKEYSRYEAYSSDDPEAEDILSGEALFAPAGEEDLTGETVMTAADAEASAADTAAVPEETAGMYSALEPEEDAAAQASDSDPEITEI